MPKVITTLQAMQHPDVVATINVLSSMNQRLQDENDELKAALPVSRCLFVLWGVKDSSGKFSPYAYWSKKDAERIASVSHVGSVAAPLYADAPQRPWVGLTDVERDDLVAAGYDRTTINMVNSLLKGKNK